MIIFQSLLSESNILSYPLKKEPDLEILMVIACLQSLGATPTVTPATDLSHFAEE